MHTFCGSYTHFYSTLHKMTLTNLLFISNASGLVNWAAFMTSRYGQYKFEIDQKYLLSRYSHHPSCFVFYMDQWNFSSLNIFQHWQVHVSTIWGVLHVSMLHRQWHITKITYTELSLKAMCLMPTFSLQPSSRQNIFTTLASTSAVRQQRFTIFQRFLNVVLWSTQMAQS